MREVAFALLGAGIALAGAVLVHLALAVWGLAPWWRALPW